MIGRKYMNAAYIPINPLLSCFTISKNFSYCSYLIYSFTCLKYILEFISSLYFTLISASFLFPAELELLWRLR